MKDTLVFECELPEGPEKVWKALTVPELLASWLLPNDIRPVQGARFSFESGGPEGAPGGRIDCEVLKVEPLRLLRYSWRTDEMGSTACEDSLDSIVTFELLPTVRGGTLLRVIHDGFPVDLRAPVAMLARQPGSRPGSPFRHLMRKAA